MGAGELGAARETEQAVLIGMRSPPDHQEETVTRILLYVRVGAHVVRAEAPGTRQVRSEVVHCTTGIRTMG